MAAAGAGVDPICGQEYADAANCMNSSATISQHESQRLGRRGHNMVASLEGGGEVGLILGKVGVGAAAPLDPHGPNDASPRRSTEISLFSRTSSVSGLRAMMRAVSLDELFGSDAKAARG